MIGEGRRREARRRQERGSWQSGQERGSSGNLGLAQNLPLMPAHQLIIVHLCTLNMYKCVQTYAYMYKVIRVSCQCGSIRKPTSTLAVS